MSVGIIFTRQMYAHHLVSKFIISLLGLDFSVTICLSMCESASAGGTWEEVSELTARCYKEARLEIY